MNRAEFSVKTPDGIRIGGFLWTSERSNQNLPVIIFVHQLGKLGGSAELMKGMASRMAKKGFDTITFNLRGIGNSGGYASWTCQSEKNDVIAVINYAEKTLNKDIILVGSSAGGPLAGSVLDFSPRIKACMLIGYVWGFWASFLFGWAYAPLQRSSKPKIFIVGDRDEFTSITQYQTRIAALEGKINIIKIIEGKNHFEIESPVYDNIVTDWLEEFVYSTVVTDSAASDSR